MDPNAALDRIIDAAVAGDVPGLMQSVDDLARWLNQDGFPPDDPRPTNGET